MKKVLILLLVIGVALTVGWFSRLENIETFEIVLTENGFEPSELSVPKGSKVVFSTTKKKPFWPASDPHPLHENYPIFDAKQPVGPEETWTFKVQKVGEWNFHDHLFFTHRGKLTVISLKEWKEKNKIVSRQELMKKIEREGAGETYTALKENSDPSNSLVHSTFHLFGEVLYEKNGVLGISICDEFSGFGCYHGFFIKAVSDRGIEVVRELDKECVNKFGVMGLGCPHGIGHGLIEFLGYDKLGEALSICSSLSWQGELFGCQGGALMEYNFRTTFKEGESVTSTRELHGNLYEPCRSLSEKFRQACYFEQASWWNEVLNSDYAKIGNLCKGLFDKEKETCLLGLGNSVAERSGYNKEIVIKACSDMSGRYEEAVCRIGGAWAFFANPLKEGLSQSICEGLGQYQNLCLEKRILVK